MLKWDHWWPLAHTGPILQPILRARHGHGCLDWSCHWLFPHPSASQGWPQGHRIHWLLNDVVYLVYTVPGVGQSLAKEHRHGKWSEKSIRSNVSQRIYFIVGCKWWIVPLVRVGTTAKKPDYIFLILSGIMFPARNRSDVILHSDRHYEKPVPNIHLRETPSTLDILLHPETKHIWLVISNIV